jgi:hypothetical protein
MSLKNQLKYLILLATPAGFSCNSQKQLSGAPKIFESLLAQLSLASRMLDGAMPEPVLNCPRVVPLVG